MFLLQRIKLTKVIPTWDTRSRVVLANLFKVWEVEMEIYNTES